VARVEYDGTPWGRTGQPDVYEPRNPFSGTVRWKTDKIPNSTDDTYAQFPDAKIKTNSKNKSDFILGDNRDRFWDTTNQVTFVDTSNSNSANRAPMFEDWEEMTPEQKRKIYDHAYNLVGKPGVKKLETAVRSKIEQRTAGGPFALRKAFKYFDRDGSGDIDPDEFFAAMEYFGLTFTDDEVLALFGTCDESNDGSLDYYEFIDKVLEKDFTGDVVVHKPTDEEEALEKELAERMLETQQVKQRSVDAFALYREKLAMKRMFTMLDVDDSGSIEKDEIKQLLEMTEKEVSDELLEQAFSRIDENRDGSLSFEELWDWWTENTTVTSNDISDLEKDVEASRRAAQGEPVDDLSLKTESAMLDFQSKSNNARYNPNKIHFAEESNTMNSDISRGNSLLKVIDGKLVHETDIHRPRDHVFGHKRSWAIPKDPQGSGKGKQLKPLFWGDKGELYDANDKKPKSGASTTRLSLPPRDPFYIPNTPRVPFTARGVLNQTLSQRRPSLANGPGSNSSGAQTTRDVNVGQFVGQPEWKGPADTTMVSSSLPWEPKTSRPYAEHNTSSSYWFGGKFQNSSPAGWGNSKLSKDLKGRPVSCPDVQPDGRPAIKTGFRLATGNIITGHAS